MMMIMRMLMLMMTTMMMIIVIIIINISIFIIMSSGRDIGVSGSRRSLGGTNPPNQYITILHFYRFAFDMFVNYQLTLC